METTAPSASEIDVLTARGVANVAFAIDGSPTNTSGTNLVTLTGTAPLEVKTIAINGFPYPITWTSVKNWSVTVPLHYATNSLTIQGSLDIHIYDVQRVEALAGPQGTLYGANALGGTIKYVTAPPDLNAYDLEEAKQQVRGTARSMGVEVEA